jgi:hypothetical protein
MRGLSAGVAAAALVSAMLAGAVGARGASTSDTCAVSGGGTSYTLHITLPAGSQQYGFAFGVPGAKVTNATLPGSNGSFSTQGLAPGTSGAWISDSPIPTSSDVTLTTSGPVTGAFRIVPATGQQPVYATAVMCGRSATVPARTVAFGVGTHASYDATGRVWHLRVSVPAAGTISAKQPEPTVGTGAAAQTTAGSEVQVGRMTVKTAGSYTLTLKPTAKADKHFATMSSLGVRLDVRFDAATGKSSSRLISLTLTR